MWRAAWADAAGSNRPAAAARIVIVKFFRSLCM